MTEFVRISTENGHEATVSKTWAEITKAKVLKDADAVDTRGRPLPESRAGGRPLLPRTTVDAEAAKSAKNTPGALRGKDLNQALEAAGLPTSGKLAERQKRLDDHLAGAPSPAADNTPEEASE
jgi:hypothetical protein